MSTKNKSEATKTASKTPSFDFGDYELGATPDGNVTIFRVFSPRAKKLELELFDRYEQQTGRRLAMQQGEDGIWNLRVDGDHTGQWYGYRVTPPDNHGKDFLPTDNLVADPYCRMATTRNTYLQDAKSMILPRSRPFDWDGDEFVSPQDHRDLIVYEAHLRDMTADESSRCKEPGTYTGLVDREQEGGIAHLKRLGINAVQLLPLQKYGYVEPPYHRRTDEGFYNTWNPYERNHWGYMTSFFFVPETRYATAGSNQGGAINGMTPEAIDEFKVMVKKLHQEGISVIMDVVYNHVSQYDRNPLKLLDMDYYFRRDEHGNYTNESGCGNDFKTEAPMARKLILDSIRYWMEEFHVDGFRFDLAHLIDWETIDAIRDTARSINPNAILIAEPWGGGYDPTGFSHHSFSAFNDQIRNGVKGSHPDFDRGFIFGEWQHDTSPPSLQNFVMGTIEGKANGRFKDPGHSINYLACHDGYTLGDFIRLGLNPKLIQNPIPEANEEDIRKLKGESLFCSKLAAFYLFVSQGIAFVHQGQEMGHSKLIHLNGANDPRARQLDNNSYEKDNPTNYLDYTDVRRNISLLEYYRGLIQLRKSAPALRKSRARDITFYQDHNDLLITFYIRGASTSDPYDYFIALNGDRKSSDNIELPEGNWELLADSEKAGIDPIKVFSGPIEYPVPTTSGALFRKLRD